MANKPLKTIKFPGLDDTYTIPQVDAALATSGAAADAKKVGDELSDLKQDLEGLDVYTLGLYPQMSVADTAVASFTDGADDIPVKSLTVDVTPVQDLHGYDHPWPAGGGANLLPKTVSFTNNGITGTVADDGTLTLNGTATDYVYIRTNISASIASGQALSISAFNPVANSNVEFSLRKQDTTIAGGWMSLGDVNKTLSFTNLDEASIWQIQITSGTTLSNFVIKPMLVNGSTPATSYAPYSNICPILGWTGANISRTGKNLVNIPTCTIAQSGSVYPSAPLPQALPAGTYTVGITSSADAAWVVTFRDASNNTVGTFASNQGATGRQTKTGTLSATATQVSVYVNAGTTLSDIMVEFGSTASAYEAFVDSDTVFIDWTTEAGTVYGGTLDVTNGVLTVDRIYVDESEHQWTQYASSNGYIAYRKTDIPAGFAAVNENDNAPISNIISEFGSFSSSAMNKNIIQTPRRNSGSAYMALAEGIDPATVTFSYLVATPQTYQLTPTEVATILGQNNIFADTGDIAELTYRADLKAYIDAHVGS